MGFFKIEKSEIEATLRSSDEINEIVSMMPSEFYQFFQTKGLLRQLRDYRRVKYIFMSKAYLVILAYFLSICGLIE